jgi:hypothetical protein
MNSLGPIQLAKLLCLISLRFYISNPALSRNGEYLSSRDYLLRLLVITLALMS